jgi:hypothetical protein
MGKMFLAASTLFVLVSCASGLSEAEVRELIQAEVASIATGPQGPSGETGERGPAGPAGVVSTACHTHAYQIPDGNHSHGISVFDSSSTSYESLFYYDGLRVTDVGEAC